jgi:hypothetical protein
MEIGLEIFVREGYLDGLDGKKHDVINKTAEIFG